MIATSDDDLLAYATFHKRDSEGHGSPLWRQGPLGHLNRAALAGRPITPHIPMDLDSARELLRQRFPRSSYVLEQCVQHDRTQRDVAAELTITQRSVSYHLQRALSILAVWTGRDLE